MPRSRTLKPSFFTNEDLAECSPLARIFFAGLWCWADREGYVEDRPRRLRGEILPYDQADGESLVVELVAAGMIERLEVDGVRVLRIITFSKHQDPHPRETPSRFAQGAPKENHGRAKVPPRSPSPSSPSSPSRPSSNSKPAALAAVPAADQSGPPVPPDTPTTTEALTTPPWEAFRAALGARMALPHDYLRIASPDKVQLVRQQIDTEVGRLGLARAVEVAAEAATKATHKPRWLAYFVGALQDASRHRVGQDAWQGDSPEGPGGPKYPDPSPEQIAEWERVAQEELLQKKSGT